MIHHHSAIVRDFLARLTAALKDGVSLTVGGRSQGCSLWGNSPGFKDAQSSVLKAGNHSLPCEDKHFLSLWECHTIPSLLFTAKLLLAVLVFFLQTSLRNLVYFLLLSHPRDLYLQGPRGLYLQGLVLECNSPTSNFMLDSKSFKPSSLSFGQHMGENRIDPFFHLVLYLWQISSFTSGCPYYLKEAVCISEDLPSRYYYCYFSAYPRTSLSIFSQDLVIFFVSISAVGLVNSQALLSAPVWKHRFFSLKKTEHSLGMSLAPEVLSVFTPSNIVFSLELCVLSQPPGGEPVLLFLHILKFACWAF